MRPSSISAVLCSGLLLSPVLARYGLTPDTVPLLTRTIKYTFLEICEGFQNPTPEPMFNEAALARTITGVSSDLYTFLMGYSVDTSAKDILGHVPSRKQDLLDDLIDEVIHSHGATDLLASRDRFEDGPEKSMLLKQDPTMHRYAEEGFECQKFQRDIKDFSEAFVNMTYAISEKCYRQCTPGGYYGSVSYALNRLQTAYERHYTGSFYAQIREIEAETGCYFNDTFMIETERAVDYSKVWVDTFQKHRTPCAGVGLG
ncbi:MAG: hypothetical protein Q9184_004998 [Pyrenodesmia sp. 2 TL-2023]